MCRKFCRLLLREVDEALLQGPAGHRSFTYTLRAHMDCLYKLAGQALQYSVLQGGPGLPVFHSLVFQLLTMRLPTTVSIADIEAVGDTEAREHIRQVCEFVTSYLNCIVIQKQSC